MTAHVGLDLGRACVKLVRCDGDAVTATERSVDPTLAGSARHDALVAVLRDAAAELKVGPRDEVHLAIPRAQGVVKRLDLPAVPSNELEQMVRLQAARELPFALEDTVLAWAEERAVDGAGVRVVFAAVLREVVDELTRVIVEAGLRPGSVEVSTQAAARTLALRGGTHAAAEVLLVEAGHSTTDVIVLQDGLLTYSRSASVGCGQADEDDGDAWLRRVEQEVMRSLVAARTRGDGGPPRSGPPDALFIAGGGAAREELVHTVAGRVGTEAELLLGTDDPDPLRAARFVVARGLADPRGVPGVPRLDLTRRLQERRARFERRRRLGGVAAGVLALAGLGLAVTAVLSSKEGEIERLKALRDELAPAVERSARLDAELARLRRWEARTGRDLELLLAVGKALPPGEPIYLTRLAWSDGRRLQVSGRAKDLATATAFFSRLQADARFARAPFESIRKPRTGEGVEFSGHAVPAEVSP